MLTIKLVRSGQMTNIILKIELNYFPDRLDVGCGEKEFKDK